MEEWIFARLNSTEAWNLTLQVSKDADFTGKIKSAVAGGGRNRYNKDSVFLSLDIEETTGGQYADNRNQRNMDSTLCKIIIG